MTAADQFTIRGMKKDMLENSNSILFLVPVNLDVKMKAVALGALFLIVKYSFLYLIFIVSFFFL